MTGEVRFRWALLIALMPALQSAAVGVAVTLDPWGYVLSLLLMFLIARAHYAHA